MGGGAKEQVGTQEGGGCDYGLGLSTLFLLRPSSRYPGSMRKDPSPLGTEEGERTKLWDGPRVKGLERKGCYVLLNQISWDLLTTIWGGPQGGGVRQMGVSAVNSSRLKQSSLQTGRY